MAPHRTFLKQLLTDEVEHQTRTICARYNYSLIIRVVVSEYY
jgi:hypothetical protein